MIENHDAVLAELTRTLVERFAPDRIVLFGSRARGDHHADSDYDLMLVLGQSLHSEDVVRRAVQDIGTSVDVFVDSCERFERRRTDVGTLEYVADREGRILYTRTSVPAEPRHVRETRNGPPESLQEWIGRAQSDFTAMAELARSGAPVRDAIVFHAHQGVEKMLKAVLVAGHIAPPRTHDLTELLPRLPSELQSDTRLTEACRGLQALWPRSRYPHEAIPTSSQVDQAVEWAQRAREIVRAVVPIG